MKDYRLLLLTPGPRENLQPENWNPPTVLSFETEEEAGKAYRQIWSALIASTFRLIKLY